MNLMDKYTTVETSGACPEQYDVFLDERKVGRMRLRGGYFYAEVGTETVFECHPKGDGMFDADERDHYMHEAIRRIDMEVDPEGLHGILDPDEPVPEIGPKEDASSDPEM
jgi:hypothetical protein